MEFEVSKENVQPLRGGRNVSQLEVALQAQHDSELQKELLQQKERFDEAISTYNGDDPLTNWYNYISWIEQSYPKHGHEGNLISSLEDCLTKFEHDSRYTNDKRMCKLWIKYIDMQQNPLELFQLLHSNNICVKCTDLYRAWALYYELRGDIKRAESVFQLGIKSVAQPYDELVNARENMLLAIGLQAIQGVDENRLLEQRQALTSLRTYNDRNRTIVPNVRISSQILHSTPGTVQSVNPSKATKSNNVPVTLYEDPDVAGPSVGGQGAYVSVLDVARKQEVTHKENTLKPGPWNSKKNIITPRVQHHTPAFKVHEDETSENYEGIRLPPGFVAVNHDDFSEWSCARCFCEPPNPIKIPMYPKHLVYVEPDIEYSLEEIRARNWVNKRTEFNENSSHMQETFMESAVIVSNEIEQAVQSILPQMEPFETPLEKQEFVNPQSVQSNEIFEDGIKPLEDSDHHSFDLHRFEYNHLNNSKLQCLPQSAIKSLQGSEAFDSRQSFVPQNIPVTSSMLPLAYIITNSKEYEEQLKQSELPVDSEILLPQKMSHQNIPIYEDNVSSSQNIPIYEDNVSSSQNIPIYEDNVSSSQNIPIYDNASNSRISYQNIRVYEDSVNSSQQIPIYHNANNSHVSHQNIPIYQDSVANTSQISQLTIPVYQDAPRRSAQQQNVPLFWNISDNSKNFQQMSQTDDSKHLTESYDFPNSKSFRQSLLAHNEVPKPLEESSVKSFGILRHTEVSKPLEEASMKSFGVLRHTEVSKPLEESSMKSFGLLRQSLAPRADISKPQEEQSFDSQNFLPRRSISVFKDSKFWRPSCVPQNVLKPVEEQTIEKNLPQQFLHPTYQDEFVQNVSPPKLPAETNWALKQNFVNNAATENVMNPEESYTVNTREAIKDVNEFWKNASIPKPEVVVQKPAVSKFAIFEDTNLPKDQKDVVTKTPIAKETKHFETYEDDHNFRAPFHSQPAPESRKSIARLFHSQPLPGDELIQDPSGMNETCTTQMFNFNLNSLKASTPFKNACKASEKIDKDAMQSETAEPVASTQPVKKALFDDIGTQGKLTIIMEATNESYKSTSSSSASVTRLKTTTFNHCLTLKINQETSSKQNYTEDNNYEKVENEKGYNIIKNLLRSEKDHIIDLTEEDESNLSLKFQNSKSIPVERFESPSKNSSNDSMSCSPIKGFQDVSLINYESHDSNSGLSCRMEYQDSQTHSIEDLIRTSGFSPFKQTFFNFLLNKIGFPNPKYSNSFIEVSVLPKLVGRKEIICLGNDSYSIKQVIGKGAYGSVYKAVSVNTKLTVALKSQKLPNKWEFYISKEIQERITNQNLLCAFMDVSACFISSKASILVCEYFKFGSLLDLKNKIKQLTGKGFTELVAIYYAMEIMTIVNALHRMCQIIHADIKPDNFLVTRMPPEFGYLSLQLIDFGCSIDMSLLPKGTVFTKAVSTENFICTEMKEGRPWTYHTDLFCIAATVHVLLFDKYMEIKKVGDTWSITQNYPRYMRAHFWNDFFYPLLNIESIDKLPDLQVIKAAFETRLSTQNKDVLQELRSMANVVRGR